MFHGRCTDLSRLLQQPPILPSLIPNLPPQIVVLKVGTSTLMDPQKSCFSLSNLGKFVDAVCDLKANGYYVVMVSSGAVGAGVIHMHMPQRPKDVVEKQATSAVGQCRIVRVWEDIFAIREQKVAQLLLTRNDLIDRPRFVNFRNTLLQLLCWGVIPIINENDALATEGLQFGDNDTLGAYVAISIGANWYFMLTDVDCLYTKNPRYHPEAEPIAHVSKMDCLHRFLDSDENMGTDWGSGGMRTKLIAAKLCCATGIHTALCHGAFPERIRTILQCCYEAIDDQLSSKSSSTSGHKKSYRSTSHDIEITSSTSPPNSVSLVSSPDEVNIISSPPSPVLSNVGQSQHAFPVRPLATTHVVLPTKEITNNSAGSNNVQGLIKPVTGTSSCHNLTTTDTQCSSLGAFITFPNLDAAPYIGTVFAGQPCTQSLRDQRRWILSLPVRGSIVVDEMCSRALVEKRKSLFAAGIKKVKDTFYPGEAVAIYSQGTGETEDCELARCLVNFGSAELEIIKGHRTAEFQQLLGYYCATEVAHRGNIIFVNPQPLYERYSIPNSEQVESDTEEDEVSTPELHRSTYKPVIIPEIGAGEVHI